MMPCCDMVLEKPHITACFVTLKILFVNVWVPHRHADSLHCLDQLVYLNNQLFSITC